MIGYLCSHFHLAPEETPGGSEDEEADMCWAASFSSLADLCLVLASLQEALTDAITRLSENHTHTCAYEALKMEREKNRKQIYESLGYTRMNE